jgi:membrane-associated protein
MTFVKFLIDVFVHLDKHLADIITQYGVWTYGFLFLVIFMETGFVVTPFLPGDSLLFAAGTFAALGSMNIWLLLILLMVAAAAGNTVNYWIGYRLGDQAQHVKWVRKEYLDRAHAFFEKYGGKAIVLARFVPIIRTFAPFVAGISQMSYGYFSLYNIVGCVAWVLLFTLAGYFFGNIPVVKANFEFVILGILVISVLPAVWEAWKARRELQKEKADAA